MLGKKIKLNKKAFTLIEMLIVVVMIGIIMGGILSISVGELNYFKYKLIGQIVNNDNVYIKGTNNILKICNIQLTGQINNTHLQVLNNKCVNYKYFVNLPNGIDFYKVQGLIMNKDFVLKNYTHRNIFKIKNGVLFIN